MENNNSFRTKYPSKDGKDEKHPVPSKVNHRLEIARKIPTPVNSRKMRLIRYKKLLAEKGETEDMKFIDEMLKQYEVKSDDEEQVSFAGDQLDSPKKTVADEDQPEKATKRSLLLSMAASPPEKLPNNWRRTQRHSFPLAVSVDGKAVKSQTRRSLPTQYRQLKPIRVDYLRDMLAKLNERNRDSTNSESNEDDSVQNENELNESIVADVQGENSVIDSEVVVVQDDMKDENNEISSDELENDIELITKKLKTCFKTPLSERNELNCICNRKVCKSRCLSCGCTMSGRVLRHCEDHPKAHLPGDHFYCKQCFADISSLREIVNG